MQIRHLAHHLARHFALGLALTAPLLAQANYSINNSVFSCSAGLSFADSQGLDAHCTGNFSVTGGTWTSDTKIALSADGSLTLDGVAMTAPVINLTSLTQVALLGTTVIRSTSSDPRSGTISDGFGQVPGRVDLQPGADVSVSGGLIRTESGFSGAINGWAISGGDVTLSAGANFGNPRGDSGGIVRGSFFGEPITGGNIVVNGRTPFLQVTSLQNVSGSISTDSSQTPLTFSTAVPEPETHTLALVALATLGAGATLARRRKA